MRLINYDLGQIRVLLRSNDNITITRENVYGTNLKDLFVSRELSIIADHILVGVYSSCETV